MNSPCELSILLTDGTVKTAYRYDGRKPMVLDRSGGYGSDSAKLTLGWNHSVQAWTALIEEQLAAMTMIDPKVRVAQVTLVCPEGVDKAWQKEVVAHSKEALGVNVRIKYRSQSIADYCVQERLEYVCLIAWGMNGFDLYLMTSVEDGSCSISQKIALRDVGLNQLAGKIKEHLKVSYLSYRVQETLSDEEDEALDGLCQQCLGYYFKHEQNGRPLKVAVNHVFPPFQLVIGQEPVAEAIQGFLTAVSNVLSEVDMTGDTCLIEGQTFRYPQAMALINSFCEAGMSKKDEVSLFGGFAKASDVRLEDYSDRTYGIRIRDGRDERFYPMVEAGEWWGKAGTGTAVMLEGNKAELRLCEMQDAEIYETVATEMIEDRQSRPISRWRIGLKRENQGKLKFLTKEEPI